MFDGIKSFLRGWNEAGKYPGYSPETMRPYIDAVATYLDDKDMLSEFMSLSGAQLGDFLAVELSYQALPFTIAWCEAALRSQNDDNKLRFIDSSLRSTIKLLDQNVKFGLNEVLFMPEEIEVAQHISALSKENGAAGDPFTEKRSWGELVDLLYSIRKGIAMHIMVEAFGQNLNEQNKIKSWANLYALHFGKATRIPPEIFNQNYVAIHIVKFWANLGNCR